MSEELAILIGQEVERHRAVEAITSLPLITSIPTPHQTATVPAGETKKVFEFNLPKDSIGFILRIANVYYPGDIVRWKIDGKEVDTGHIRRVIGSINSPTEVVPWFRIPFYVSDVWEVTNRDTEDHEYEVLNEGFYIEKKDLGLVLKLAGVKG
jgi:hypothetical protein